MKVLVMDGQGLSVQHFQSDCLMGSMKWWDNDHHNPKLKEVRLVRHSDHAAYRILKVVRH